jgi:hypothetical protein
VSTRQAVTARQGRLSPDRPRRSGRCPAGNCLLRRPASRWCNVTSRRVPRTMLVHIEPHTSPSLWWTPTEVCHAGPCKKLDVHRSCMCRHTRYRGTPPAIPTPYCGFAFNSHGHLIVSEPLGATPVIPRVPLSAVSSFTITRRGDLQATSASVPNGRVPPAGLLSIPARRMLT